MPRQCGINNLNSCQLKLMGERKAAYLRSRRTAETLCMLLCAFLYPISFNYPALGPSLITIFEFLNLCQVYLFSCISCILEVFFV